MKVRFQSRNYTHKKKKNIKPLKKQKLPYNKKSKNITSLEKNLSRSRRSSVHIT